MGEGEDHAQLAVSIGLMTTGQRSLRATNRVKFVGFADQEAHRLADVIEIKEPATTVRGVGGYPTAMAKASARMRRISNIAMRIGPTLGSARKSPIFSPICSGQVWPAACASSDGSMERSSAITRF